MIDDELTKLTDQLLNKNLQLSETQQINFAKNLETRQRFKKDFETFKTKPDAEVLNIKTGETVTDLKKLIDEQGTKNPPTTVAGQLETTGKRLEQKGKELEEVTKPKSVIGDIMRDYSDFNKYMQSSQKTGYVRATVRQIMREDIQAGKLKLSKELQDQVMQGTGEPIDVYRKVYGEGALEQIDSLADDLGQFRTEEEAAKFARSKYTFEPKVKPVDESKTYEELEDILKKGPDEPEGKAQGGIIGYAMGGRIGFKKGKRVLDIITNANKKLKDKKSMESVNPKTGEVTVPKEPVKPAEGMTVMDQEPVATVNKKPTKEDYEDYGEILNDSENTVVQGTETFDELDALVKKQKDYEGYMFQQYKRGKLDPAPGEQTEDRMKFLQKKFDEVLATGDRRLITLDEAQELQELQFASRRKPKVSEADMIKQKYGNVIDEELLQKIIVDDNPQRKAEVLASLDEALKMEEKGMSPQEIINIINNTTRTKQAKGGPAGGLDYLMGF